MAVVARRRRTTASPTVPEFFALTPDQKFQTFRATFPKAAASMVLMMDLVWEAAAARRRRDARRKKPLQGSR